jgi:hypothetical protein
MSKPPKELCRCLSGIWRDGATVIADPAQKVRKKIKIKKFRFNKKKTRKTNQRHCGRQHIESRENMRDQKKRLLAFFFPIAAAAAAL